MTMDKKGVFEEDATAAPGAGRAEKTPRTNGPSGRHLLVVFSVVVVIAVIVAAAGIIPRLKSRAAVKAETLRMAVPTVSVVHPRRGQAAQEIELPANIQAFTDAPIYARTNGYLKRWTANIGTRVKAGQLLAEIDTPEIDQQLQQARADLATMQANLHLAEITALRYQELLKTDSVSKQDADNTSSDFEAKRATVQSAQANVKRLEDLQSFQRIYAPFDGVITARNIDVGALIDAGSSGGPARELFHIASTSKLRVYVNVPQEHSPSAKPGLKADLILQEFPGRRFPGVLVATANAIDQASRTLLAEFDVENPVGELLPGSYAKLILKLPTSSPSFFLPVNTLLFRSEGLRVCIIDSNNRAGLKPVVLGRDFGSEVEVVSGLDGNETVVVDPPDSVASGDALRVTQEAPAKGGVS